MSERYDLAIVGSGPAGLSAALNAKIRKKKFIIFGSNELSSKLVKAEKINNYLGLYGESGKEISDRFKNHLKAMDIEITEERINNIYAMGDYYSLMADNKVYEASAVILATGVNFGKPLKGEEEFLGKGVGYCATCDAPLYKDKVVTIISYNKRFEEEADFISEIASKVNYIAMYKEDVEVNNAIEVIKGIPEEITGNNKAKRLILKDSAVIESDGIFILRDSISPKQLVPGLEMEGNHIKVNRNMHSNLKGCFAAGDIVGTPYQYIKAAGEGNIAALSAVSYLEEVKRMAKK